MPEERDAYFRTSSGKALDNEYSSEDLADWSEDEKLGHAGEAPFTRGNHASGYKGRLWTMRQYAGYATAAESNRRYRHLLEQGQSGLSVAFDLPTQIGYDSDHKLAQGEVGRVGVAIDSLEDMETLFDSIPLERVSTSMTINATAATLLALYIAVGRRQGVADERISGTVQNDILKEYIARGTYIYPPGPSMRLATDVIEFCGDKLPRFNPISISGYHIREAGSTAAQELAFTLANGLAYVEAAAGRGLDVDDFGQRCRSSSTLIEISWRRSRSSAPPAASGARCCASATTPRIRERRCCASTRRPRARRSPRSSPTSTSCVRHFKA